MIKKEPSLSLAYKNHSQEQRKELTPVDNHLISLLSQWIRIDKDKSNWEEIIALSYGSLPAIFHIPDQELKRKLNLSEKDLVVLKLLHEAAIRQLRLKIYSHSILQNKSDFIHYLIALLAREYIEHFFIYFIDAKGMIIQEEHQSKGTINSAFVYIREVIRKALQFNVKGLILVHNHPSGIAQPSEADKKLTASMMNMLKIMDIKTIDHIIIGNGTYYSFEENGLLIPED